MRRLTEEQRHKVREILMKVHQQAACLQFVIKSLYLVFLFGVSSLASQLDISLQQDSAVYKSFRIKGSIGPMRVQLVAEGAFNKLRKQMMAYSSTSPNTFKMQRVLRRKEYAEFLLGKTIS